MPENLSVTEACSISPVRVTSCHPKLVSNPGLATAASFLIEIYGQNHGSIFTANRGFSDV